MWRLTDVDGLCSRNKYSFVKLFSATPRIRRSRGRGTCSNRIMLGALQESVSHHPHHYKAVDHKSSRLVFQEVSDLWRATTSDAVNISDNFSQREFAAALQHLKPGKAPGPDSICPEFILHAGAALKSWLRDFISSFCADSKFPRSGEERLWSRSQN